MLASYENLWTVMTKGGFTKFLSGMLHKNGCNTKFKIYRLHVKYINLIKNYPYSPGSNQIQPIDC